MKEELTRLLNNAYAPYSHFKVASAVQTTDGHIFYGINVENAVGAASVCAERNAINTAITNGYKVNDLNALYVLSSSNNITYPCFVCRQVIAEFFTADADVTLYSETDEQTLKVTELLPYPFSKEDLNL